MPGFRHFARKFGLRLLEFFALNRNCRANLHFYGVKAVEKRGEGPGALGTTLNLSDIKSNPTP